jgi:hypothetical protein
MFRWLFPSRARRPQPRFRPRLESLESRDVPSVTLTSGGALYGPAHTGSTGTLDSDGDIDKKGEKHDKHDSADKQSNSNDHGQSSTASPQVVTMSTSTTGGTSGKHHHRNHRDH